MRPLDDAQRRRYLVWSAVLCAIPLCLAPLAGRSAFELADEQATFSARFSTPALDTVWSEKPVAVVRDPFTPERTTHPALTDTGVVGMQVTQGQPIGFALPPNRGAAGTPLQGVAFTASQVTAVVTGTSPRALIDDGAHVRVIGIGDVIAGSRVVAIDGAGVHLQNGTLLALAENEP